MPAPLLCTAALQSAAAAVKDPSANRRRKRFDEVEARVRKVLRDAPPPAAGRFLVKVLAELSLNPESLAPLDPLPPHLRESARDQTCGVVLRAAGREQGHLRGHVSVAQLMDERVHFCVIAAAVRSLGLPAPEPAVRERAAQLLWQVPARKGALGAVLSGVAAMQLPQCFAEAEVPLLLRGLAAKFVGVQADCEVLCEHAARLAERVPEWRHHLAALLLPLACRDSSERAVPRVGKLLQRWSLTGDAGAAAGLDPEQLERAAAAVRPPWAGLPLLELEGARVELVDSDDSARRFAEHVHRALGGAPEGVAVGVDCEWGSSQRPLALLQLAVQSGGPDAEPPTVFLVDFCALQTGDQPAANAKAADAARRLLAPPRAGGHRVAAFAAREDAKRLRQCGLLPPDRELWAVGDDPAGAPADAVPWSDVQASLFWGARGTRSPSLARCVAQGLERQLCKEEQCSDWERRPLSQEQLHYAALDALAPLRLLPLCAGLWPPPRPVLGGPQRGAPRAGAPRGPGPRPGDWTCGRCGANVFASKASCFRCRAPKPEAAGAAGAAHADPQRPAAAVAAGAPQPPADLTAWLADDDSDLTPAQRARAQALARLDAMLEGAGDPGSDESGPELCDDDSEDGEPPAGAAPVQG
eukprot:TRINITY_DN34166_c0_g1_i1.p1 TRINITY_DN34166_c0_g1~~TRINITY_DN34166_c0_g1_i1.p1  ORF type:complete len:671 (+),score=201.13 TRINITY_DN34166_c0_g1_i1:91-2013(+)